MSEDRIGSITRVLAMVNQSWLGKILDLVRKLVGPDGRHWFCELEKFLKKEVCWRKTGRFPVFKTITIGFHKTASELRSYVMGERICVWPLAYDIFEKMPLVRKKTKVTLYEATVEELTGKRFATLDEIFEEVISRGYILCPAEVGPYLRLVYTVQPVGEKMCIAMEKVPVEGSEPRAFVLQHDKKKGLILSWIGGYSNHHLNGDDIVIFMSPE
tara:strand:+ start:196 stop:837 length:642 start_codon:yes stop_codon:yes gene_type:complete